MDNNIVLVAGAARVGSSWMCMTLSYILNATYLEPYCLLRGISWDGREEIIKLTSGQLLDREKSNFRFIVKTHEPPDPHYSLTKALIVIIRDPRDCIISQYLRRKVIVSQKSDIEKKGVEIALQPKTTIKLGIKGTVYNLLYSNKIFAIVLGALKWNKFYQEWTKLHFAKLIKFEDMKTKPTQTMSTILDHLSVHADNDIIDQAFEEFSILKRNKEKTEENKNTNLTFRKGIIGDHKEHFNFIHLLIIRLICGKTAKKFGYDL